MTGSDWMDGAAERDAAMLAFRQERAWEQEQASRQYGQWAAYARQLVAEASPVAAGIIEHGLAEGIRCWQMQERARAQVEESRAERVAYDAGLLRAAGRPDGDLELRAAVGVAGAAVGDPARGNAGAGAGDRMERGKR